jgi:two-component system, LytTR family, sensor histidine kinase AlgZ
MTSINQNAYSSALPNFRNLGILLRILLIVNVLAIAAAVVKAPVLSEAWRELVEVSAVVQPLLAITLLALVLLNSYLQRLPYPLGVFAVFALTLALSLIVLTVALRPYEEAAISMQRYGLLVVLTTALLFAYLDFRGRALSPALTEARLQALQARIRPHFLFNSLNAVLSLIRQDPKRAEVVLEDLAELFRVAMGNERELSPLSKEIELCRQYLEIEQLRLGERLRVVWHIDNMPADALVPPLLLQPLIENAVYHGIEPRVEPGEIVIDIYVAKQRVHAVLRNPYSPQGTHHSGNKMALNNIRERLQLHFDAEATLDMRVREDIYQVHIVLPYVKARLA